jgi:cobalt/nickel transport system permease protein
MPEWLMKTETYIPSNDRAAFLDRSILSFLRLLSRIRAQSDYDKDRLFVSPFFKLIFTLMYIVLLSLSQSAAYLYAMLTYIALVLCLMPGREIRKILRGSLTGAVFTALILIPAALGGNFYSISVIPAKVFASVTAVNILSYSTRWDRIIGALKILRFPDIFIFVLDIAIKYIYMLGEFTLGLLCALKLRSVGKDKTKYNALGGIAGTLFIKSKEMSEEMYGAMECRGFTGEYRSYYGFKFTPADTVFILINAGLVYLFVVLK